MIGIGSCLLSYEFELRMGGMVTYGDITNIRVPGIFYGGGSAKTLFFQRKALQPSRTGAALDGVSV